MKRFALAGIALLLSGCAASTFDTTPPYYDRNQHALIGAGYPVERIDMPRGFEFADIYSAERSQSHDSPGDSGSANVTEAGVSWVNRSGDTAIATAMHQGVGGRSHWLPWEESDGYEFVGNARVQYGFYTGPYREVTGDAASVPPNAPECAASSHLLMHTPDRRKRTVYTYTEGVDCDDIASLGERYAQDQRQRAYRAFGIR